MDCFADVSFALYNTVNIGFGFGWCITMSLSGSEIFFMIVSAYMLGGVLMMHQWAFAVIEFIRAEHNLKWYIYGK
jgi:hypothetical protein